MQNSEKSEQQGDLPSIIEQEATRGWLDLLASVQRIKQQQEDQLDQLRIQMTRNYNSLTAETNKQNYEEIAKKWIRENLEEAQLFIDRVVGIKGVTEDPVKVAAEIEGCSSNVIAANTEGTLQALFIDDDNDDHHQQPSHPLPRVSISSSIIPSSDELYGY
jgi:hypothetical protein